MKSKLVISMERLANQIGRALLFSPLDAAVRRMIIELLASGIMLEGA